MTEQAFRVLALCTGNICRSPFAEGYLRLALERAGLSHGVELRSAGIHAVHGHPASSTGIRIAAKYGVDLSSFASTPATEALLEAQHLVLTMEEQHDDHLLEHFVSTAGRKRPLGSFATPAIRNIIDPIGGDASVYEASYQAIVNGVNGMVAEWKSVQKRYFEGGGITIAMGGDHRGYALKKVLKEYLQDLGCEIIDVGTHDRVSCDHPDYAFAVGELVAMRKAERGILICSSGHGMVVSVNKVQGIRGVVPFCEEHAEVARHHNNANVLCMPADYISVEECRKVMNAFLRTEFLGGKYQRRINKISRAERVHEPSVTRYTSASA